jgi:hypothetical protein
MTQRLNFRGEVVQKNSILIGLHDFDNKKVTMILENVGNFTNLCDVTSQKT